MTRVMHPNSLKNLATPFGPARDPKPYAPQNAGSSVIEWYNTLANQKGIDDAALAAIASDEMLPRTKRMAAKSLMRTLNDEYAKNGRPFAADDLDRVLDRCHGKPVQRVAVARVDVRDPEQVRSELMAILAERPELRVALLGEGAAAGVGAPNAGGKCG